MSVTLGAAEFAASALSAIKASDFKDWGISEPAFVGSSVIISLLKDDHVAIVAASGKELARSNSAAELATYCVKQAVERARLDHRLNGKD